MMPLAPEPVTAAERRSQRGGDGMNGTPPKSRDNSGSE